MEKSNVYLNIGSLLNEEENNCAPKCEKEANVK